MQTREIQAAAVMAGFLGVGYLASRVRYAWELTAGMAAVSASWAYVRGIKKRDDRRAVQLAALALGAGAVHCTLAPWIVPSSTAFTERMMRHCWTVGINLPVAALAGGAAINLLRNDPYTTLAWRRLLRAGLGAAPQPFLRSLLHPTYRFDLNCRNEFDDGLWYDAVEEYKLSGELNAEQEARLLMETNDAMVSLEQWQRLASNEAFDKVQAFVTPIELQDVEAKAEELRGLPEIVQDLQNSPEQVGFAAKVKGARDLFVWANSPADGLLRAMSPRARKLKPDGREQHDKLIAITRDEWPRDLGSTIETLITKAGLGSDGINDEENDPAADAFNKLFKSGIKELPAMAGALKLKGEPGYDSISSALGRLGLKTAQDVVDKVESISDGTMLEKLAGYADAQGVKTQNVEGQAPPKIFAEIVAPQDARVNLMVTSVAHATLVHVAYYAAMGAILANSLLEHRKLAVLAASVTLLSSGTQRHQVIAREAYLTLADRVEKRGDQAAADDLRLAARERPNHPFAFLRKPTALTIAPWLLFVWRRCFEVWPEFGSVLVWSLTTRFAHDWATLRNDQNSAKRVLAELRRPGKVTLNWREQRALEILRKSRLQHFEVADE